MKSVSTLNFTVFSDDLSLIPVQDKKCRIINTISPNSYGITTKDKEFETALKSSNYLVLDGFFGHYPVCYYQGKIVNASKDPMYFINRLNKQGGNHNRDDFFKRE